MGRRKLDLQEVEFISYSIKSLWETPFLRESFFVSVCRMNVGVGNSLLFLKNIAIFNINLSNLHKIFSLKLFTRQNFYDIIIIGREWICFYYAFFYQKQLRKKRKILF